MFKKSGNILKCLWKYSEMFKICYLLISEKKGNNEKRRKLQSPVG